jgi:hypothetical protein
VHAVLAKLALHGGGLHAQFIACPLLVISCNLDCPALFALSALALTMFKASESVWIWLVIGFLGFIFHVMLCAAALLTDIGPLTLVCAWASGLGGMATYKVPRSCGTIT